MMSPECKNGALKLMKLLDEIHEELLPHTKYHLDEMSDVIFKFLSYYFYKMSRGIENKDDIPWYINDYFEKVKTGIINSLKEFYH